MASTLKSRYLFLYNTALFLSWAAILFIVVNEKVVEQHTNAQLWQVIEVPLKLAQTAALFEVLHAALGIVRSPVLITATQVASRLLVVWGIINLVPHATTTGSIELLHVGNLHLKLDLASLLVAWGLSEVIRYSFFAFKELGAAPYPALWLRYSGFIVLYPVGVASEVAMILLALPHIKEHKLLSVAMPNPVNFAFSYYTAVLLALASYVPGLPLLYGYMLKQRRKVLGKPKAKTT